MPYPSAYGPPILAIETKDPPKYNIHYAGGSLDSVKGGADLKLFVNSKEIRITQGKKDALVLAVAKVTEVSYGQEVHRRVGTAVAVGIFNVGCRWHSAALSKSKKHYIGLTWADGTNTGGMMFQSNT